MRGQRRNRNRNNPSGRRCDLIQKGGPTIVIRHYYHKHCHVMKDLLRHMGLLPRYEMDVSNCHFCKNRFSTRFLSGISKDDRLLSLLYHFVVHGENWIESHPIERYLHMVSSLIACYICKGSYPQYVLCKNLDTDQKKHTNS